MEKHVSPHYRELMSKLLEHGLLVVGYTGTGKAIALEHIIRDLRANGKTVQVIHSYHKELAPSIRNGADILVMDDEAIKEYYPEIDDFILFMETIRTKGVNVILVLQTLFFYLSKEQQRKIFNLFPAHLVFEGRDLHELYIGYDEHLNLGEAYLINTENENRLKLQFEP